MTADTSVAPSYVRPHTLNELNTSQYPTSFYRVGTSFSYLAVSAQGTCISINVGYILIVPSMTPEPWGSLARMIYLLGGVARKRVYCAAQHTTSYYDACLTFGPAPVRRSDIAMPYTGIIGDEPMGIGPLLKSAFIGLFDVAVSKLRLTTKERPLREAGVAKMLKVIEDVWIASSNPKGASTRTTPAT